jgi:hypothetical protein
VDNEAVSLCKPTQGSGTTAYEVFLAWTVANNPRDFDIMAQTDLDAEDLFRLKILETLKASPSTRAIISAAGQNGITKNRMDLPTMKGRIHGPSINSMQSRSVEVLLLDEPWRYPLGTIQEIIERTSTLEATRKIFSVSQAGEEIIDKFGNPMMDEWGQWWHRGTQEEYRVACPKCGIRYYPETKNFRCADDSRDPETKVWNWRRVVESAFHITPCCEHRVENTPENRRSLSASGKYFATNPNPSPRHRSFRYSSWIVYWQDWGGLLAQFLRAQESLHAGDIAPIKIWTQKKEARWWTIRDADVPVVNSKGSSGYRFETYERNAEEDAAPKCEFEERRFAGVDMQRDRFPIIIRAFGDGKSRLIFCDELKHFEEIKEAEKHFDVPSAAVGFDVGNWKAEAIKQCFINHWSPLRGRDISNFTKSRGARKPVKIPYQAVIERLTGDMIYGAGKTIKVWEWSNIYFKDIFSRLRAMPEHQIPDDISQLYIDSMESEAKDAKTGVWKQIGRRPNHFWDCEAEIAYMAFLYKLVGTPIKEDDGSED